MIQIDFVGCKKSKQPTLLDDQGREIDYEIFAAVSTKSRKTYAVAIESQAKLPVLAAFVSMFRFFGGVPVLLTIDNFAAAVSKPRKGRDEAITTPEFQEIADHYQVGLKAARVRKPRDIREIGPNAERIIDEHFRINKRPDATAKAAMKLRALTDRYSADRIDLACARAITVGKKTVAKVESILTSGLDRLANEPTEQPGTPKATSNVRGASYFASLLNEEHDDCDV